MHTYSQVWSHSNSSVQWSHS